MDLDIGLIIGIALILAFFGGVTWLEILSRRQRRRRADDEDLGAAKRNVAEKRSRKRSQQR